MAEASNEPGLGSGAGQPTIPQSTGSELTKKNYRCRLLELMEILGLRMPATMLTTPRGPRPGGPLRLSNGCGSQTGVALAAATSEGHPSTLCR